MTDYILLSICILSILTWALFKAVNKFFKITINDSINDFEMKTFKDSEKKPINDSINDLEKNVKIKVSNMPTRFFSSMTWGKIILTASVIFIVFSYFYCDRKITNLRGRHINQELQKGWKIKESYQDHETIFFLLERNLINKWLYE